MTNPPEPPNNQPGSTPGQPNPYGNTGQPGQPQYGQPASPQPGQPSYGQPAAGQPGQPSYGQPTPGATPAGGPGAYPPGGYAPPPAPPQRHNWLRRRLPAILIAIVVVIIVAIVGAIVGNKKDGKSVKGSDVGMCIKVSGSSFDVDTDKVDCNSPELSYIVAEKLSSSDACTASNKRYLSLSDTRSDDVLCLVPNLRAGKCYKESSLSDGLDEVPCTEESFDLTTVFKVTQRVVSTSVPDCTDPEKQKSEVYEKVPAPNGPLGYCLQIQGDYTFEPS